MTRDKHESDQRFSQTAEENGKLVQTLLLSIFLFVEKLFLQKIRFDEIQLKLKTNEQQIRQLRHDNDQLNKEVVSTRRSVEDQLLSSNAKHQEMFSKMRIDFDRAESRSNECEKFVKVNRLLGGVVELFRLFRNFSLS